MCPRCGSNDTSKAILNYADGPMESEKCLECGYLDVKRPPSYISPLTMSAATGGRRDPITKKIIAADQQTEVV